MISLSGFAQQQEEKLRIGLLPIIDHLPLVISQKEIAVPLKGVRIDLDLYRSWTGLEAAYRTGAVDGAAIDLSKALIMAYDGVPLKIVLVLSRNGTALVVNSDNPEDIKGKIIASSGSDTIQLLIFNEFLKKKGLRMGYDVRSVITRFAKATMRMKEEKFYGFCLPEPYGALAEEEGVVNKLILSKDIVPNQISSVLIVSPQVIASKPGMIKTWVRSVIKSMEFIERDKTASGGRQSAVSQTDVFRFDPKVVERILTGPLDRVSFKDFSPSETEIKETAIKLMKVGILGGLVDFKKIIDKEYTKYR